MLNDIKQNMFTIHGVITSVIHVMIMVGILASWVFVKIQVLGEDVEIAVPSAQAMKGKLR